MAENTNFTIPKDGYLAFDALTFKQFIKDRLNETNVFTDQNFEGSYLSTVTEIIAYTFHVLMYYLNRTSTEALFSEAQLYENMNRIVTLLDYKPIGRQSATLNFGLTAGPNFDIGLYTIPRYSYLQNDPSSYAFNEDIVFAKTTAYGTQQDLTTLSQQKLLYQGRYAEYPLYTAAGNENEVIYFAPGDNIIVDHFNIDVYVKEPGDKWKQWKRVPTLYLEDAFSESYETRFNENKRYEIKFGNNINGKKLAQGTQVSIYYLKSNGRDGELGKSAINGRKLSVFSTRTFDEILVDLNIEQNNEVVYLDSTQIQNLRLENTNVSTYYQTEENTDAIRQNASGVFRSQYRVVTEQDHQNYIKTNFANLIHDARVVNNWTYLAEQIKYYYQDIGLKDPNNVSNILYNQLYFADGCNFNNVYATVVPKTIPDTKNPTANLTPAQKELIISSLKSVKTLTSEVIILDPVYIAVGVCIANIGNANGVLDDLNKSELFIVKDPNSRRDNNSIKLDVVNVFDSYFSRDNMTLGAELDVSYLTSQLLSIQGVKTFYTRRTDNPAIRYNGLSLMTWNPIYPTDHQITTKNISMSYFKYLFLFDKEYFSNKISVSSEAKIYENIEY